MSFDTVLSCDSRRDALRRLALLLAGSSGLLGCERIEFPPPKTLYRCMLDHDCPVDACLQTRLEAIDAQLRAQYGLSAAQSAVGVLDLQRMRLAMIHPDRIEYAASVAKIGILLAYFDLRRESARSLSSETRHELGLMIKSSSNEMAAKFSRELGLREIQRVLDRHGFYDARRGGGIWVGKHYGAGNERYRDPVGDHSHAATVRQLLRFYLMLEQGRLISPDVSRVMREIFVSPDIPHDRIKFVRGLEGRDVLLLRKWGSWENWLHDSAIITGPGRRYILVALTNHPKGDAYLEDLARAVDDEMLAAQ